MKWELKNIPKGKTARDETTVQIDLRYEWDEIIFSFRTFPGV